MKKAISTEQPLSIIKNFSITLCTQDEATYSIQILDLRDKTIIATLSLDPMDHTIAGTISSDAVKKMGDDAQAVLNELSKTLQTHIGSKEFILIPSSCSLPEFIPAQDHSFKRLRQTHRNMINQQTQVILAQHADLVHKLDEQFEFVVGASNARKKVYNLEQRVFDLLNGHANFTEEKMTEYKSEEIQGVKSRLNNINVTSIFMINKQAKLCGILRSLSMGDKTGYLSDETIIQDIISLDLFPGNSEEEKTNSRRIFLLAYFANRAISLFEHQDQFFIIAANGRELDYETIGCQKLLMNSNEYTLTMKLAPPSQLLNDIKEQLLAPLPVIENMKPFSMVSSLGEHTQETKNDKQENAEAKYN